MIKYRVGDQFKIIPTADPTSWWSEEIIHVYRTGKIKTKVIDCPDSNPGFIGNVQVYGNDWFSPQHGYESVKIRNTNTKLRKILYK